MQHREFGRAIISTDTVRRMDRNELERELAARGVPVDEQDPDDRLRDDLLIAVSFRSN